MKFKLLAAALAAVSLATASLAQTFTPEAFRSHVMFLADDLMEGRETGTRGYDIAARYVASRFEALGLTPAANGSWYQEVPFVRFGMTGQRARVVIGRRGFAQGEQVVIRQHPEAGALRLTAPVVFAGYGIDAPASGHDDYAGLDVQGRVVAVLSGTPSGWPSDVAAHLNSDKQRLAEARGAVGMVVIRTRAEAERRPWARFSHGGSEPGLTWVAPDGRPHSNAPGLRFHATLGPDAAEALFAGAPRTLGQVLDEAAQEGARPRGFALAQRVTVERDSANAPLTSSNVVAVLPGSDPALANEYVVLTAHLDGLGIGEDGAVRAGAMDNATGVSALLEAARALATSGQRPRRPILFAAVTAEEKGLLGAGYLARNPVVDGRIVGLVNLDMPVLLYDFVDVIAFGAEHSTMGPIVARAAARMNVAVSPDPLPREGLFTRSDHYMFVREGVPSVFLMTGFGNGGQEQFTGFLAGPYHSADDNLRQPINWQAGARFAQLNYLIAREIADAPEAPRWYEGSFFGETFAPGQAKAARPAQ